MLTLQMFFRGTYESPRMAASISLLFLICLDKLYAAGDIVSTTRKIKIIGSEFEFFVSIFGKLEEIIILHREW